LQQVDQEDFAEQACHLHVGVSISRLRAAELRSADGQECPSPHKHYKHFPHKRLQNVQFVA
jgi:hypothetical protein